MKKVFLIIISIIVIFSILGSIYIHQKKAIANEIIMEEIKNRGWEKNIKDSSIHYNIMLGRVEKNITYIDEPKNEYIYYVSPSVSVFKSNNNSKVYGETNIEKNIKNYKYNIIR